MAKALPLPDGTTVAIREGETPAQTWARAQQMYPEAFGFEEEKEARPKQDTSGLKAAASAGLTRLGGGFELLKGKAGFKDQAEAQREYEAAEKKASERFTPTEKGWSEDPFLKFRETLGGSLPYMVAPAAAGLSALALPATLPAAAIGLLGAGAVSAGQFTGSNLARQVGTGKSLEEASGAAALGAAIPQALIDTAAMALLPGVGKLFGSVGSKLTTEQAKAIASQTLGKAAMDYTAKTGMAMGREGFTEVVQQSLERLQAGLNIADPEAREEYIESFIGGAVLGGAIAPAGRYIERSGAKTQAARAERDERNVAAKEAAEQARVVAEKEAAERQTPEYALKIVNEQTALEQEKVALDQQIRKITKDSLTEAEDKAFNKQINAQLQINAAARNERAPEVSRVKQSGLYQQALEQERVAGLTPEEYALEQTKTVSNKPAKIAEPDLEGYYEQQIVVPSEERRKAEEAERARVAAIPLSYAAERMELARSQMYEPSGQDYVEYLLQDPYKAGLIVETKKTKQGYTPLPGLTRSESNLILDEVAKRLKAMSKEELAARQAELQGQKIGGAPANPMAAFMEQSDTLDTDRRQGVTDADLAFIEKQAAMPTKTTTQGELFGGAEQRVNMPQTGTPVEINAQIAELERQLDVAKSYGAPDSATRPRDREGRRANRERVSTLMEQITDLKDRQAKIASGAPMGVKSDAALSAYIAAGTPDRKPDESIEDWYARTENVTPTTSGLPEQEKTVQARRDALSTFTGNDYMLRNGLGDIKAPDVETAKQSVVDAMLKEIGDVRGKLKPETITAIETQVRQLLDNKMMFGQDYNQALDTISNRWRAGIQRGKYGATQPTPTQTSTDMLRTQMDRAFAQRQRYDAQTLSILDQIAENFKAFNASPERRNMAGEWLNRVTQTGRSSPEMTRDLQNELARLEEGKRSETETPMRQTAFGLATKPTQTAVQQELDADLMPEAVAPQSETRVVNGKVQYVSPEDKGPLQGSVAERYAPAQKGTIFATQKELDEYLSSDYLKEARENQGLARETVSRLSKQVSEYEAKIADTQKQIDALQARRAELQTLQVSERRTADKIVADTEVQLEELLKQMADDLGPIRMALEQAEMNLAAAEARSEETSRLIANNISQFEYMDNKVVRAAQETVAAKAELRKARNKLGSLEEKRPGIEEAQRKVIAALQRQRNPVLYEMQEKLQELQVKLSKARVVQPQTVERLKKEIAELEDQMDVQRDNPYVPSSAMVTFLNNDMLLYLSTREDNAKIGAAKRSVGHFKKKLDKAASDLKVDLSTHPEVKALREQISVSKELGTDALRGVEGELALLDDEIEKAQLAQQATQRQADNIEDQIIAAGEERTFAGQLAGTTLDTVSALDRAETLAKDKKKLEDFQDRTKRLAALPGQRIDFSKRQEMFQMVNAATEDFAELDASIEDLREGVEELQVRDYFMHEEMLDLQDQAKSFRGPRKNSKAGKEHFAKMEAHKKKMEENTKRIQSLRDSITQYEKTRVTKQAALAKAEVAMSGDPEVYQTITKSIDERMAKLDKTIAGKQAAVVKGDAAILEKARDIKAKADEGKTAPEKLNKMRERLKVLKASQADRNKHLKEYLKERDVLKARRSNRLGITRTLANMDALKEELATAEARLRTVTSTINSTSATKQEKAAARVEAATLTEAVEDLRKRTTTKPKKATLAEQEMFDAEIARVQELARAQERKAELDNGLAALQKAKEPKTEVKKTERAERIAKLQDDINKQQTLIDSLTPKEKGAVSQATKIESSAPGKLRAGTAESKANKGVSRRPITESRTARSITSEKAVADANAFALRLANAKTPETLDAEFAAKGVETQNQIIEAVENNIARLRIAADALANDLLDLTNISANSMTPQSAARKEKVRDDLGYAERMLDGALRDREHLLNVQEEAEAAAPADQEEKGLPSGFKSFTGKDSVGEVEFDPDAPARLQKGLFSRGVPVQGLTGAELRNELNKAIGDEPAFSRTVSVFNTVQEFLDTRPRYNGKIPFDAKGFVDPKSRRAYLFAENIAKGEGLGILLHEVGVHIGFRNFFNAGQFKALANAVRNWGKAPANTLEGKIGRAAEKRVREAGTPANQVDDELIAYAVEEAVKAGVEPAGVKSGSAVQNWLRMIVNAFNKALETLGLAPEKIKVGDLVNMAYGAAQLELKGTWHGTGKLFTEFDHKYMGTGEGAQAFSWGTYRAQNKRVAGGYQNLGAQKQMEAWLQQPEIVAWMDSQKPRYGGKTAEDFAKFAAEGKPGESLAGVPFELATGMQLGLNRYAKELAKGEAQQLIPADRLRIALQFAHPTGSARRALRAWVETADMSPATAPHPDPLYKGQRGYMLDSTFEGDVAQDILRFIAFPDVWGLDASQPPKELIKTAAELARTQYVEAAAYDGAYSYFKQQTQVAKAKLKALDKIDLADVTYNPPTPAPLPRPTGNMLRTLHGRKENEYLQWDLPEDKQPPVVAKALKQAVDGLGREARRKYDAILAPLVRGNRVLKGADVYEALGGAMESNRAASELLHSFGVAGTKFLDRRSRSNRITERSTYNYVDYSDKDAGAAILGADLEPVGPASGLLFSRGPTTAPSTVNTVNAELKKYFKDLTRIKIYSSVDALITANPQYKRLIPADARGFVDTAGNKAFLIAENIDQGQALGVLLHEVGAHVGLKNILGESQYTGMVNAIKGWAKKNDGSVESVVAKAAIARVEAAKTDAKHRDDELIAYAVEEAVKAGVIPNQTKGVLGTWLSRIADGFRKLLTKFGMDLKSFDAQGLVDIAYGAAQMEMRAMPEGMSRRTFLRGAVSAVGQMYLPAVNTGLSINAKAKLFDATLDAADAWFSTVVGMAKTPALRNMLKNYSFDIDNEVFAEALYNMDSDIEGKDSLYSHMHWRSYGPGDSTESLMDLLKDKPDSVERLQAAVLDMRSQLVAAIDKLPKKQNGEIAEDKLPAVGDLLFSRKAAAPADALEALSKKIIAQPKTLKEKLGSNLALQLEMQGVDMRAGLRDTLKFGDDTLFKQAMYHVRKAEQKMAQMFTVMNSGPLVAYKDSKGLVGYRSSNQNSAREVFDAIADIPVDNPQLKTDLAQTYLVAVRANNKGLPKLDLGAMKLEQADLDAALAAADANPALKSALENVRRKYSAYNKGMIEFLASTGRISKKMAADLLKEGDYVPFYRVDKNGKADLVFNNNVTFNVGDIRRQPYLAELKGGDTKLLPLNEALQRNTLLLTDMALTNNAAKSVAYGLQALGVGKGPINPLTGKPTNLMAIKPGFGPDDAKVIRFYHEPDPSKPDDDGKRHIVVNTEGTLAEGIPAELVVKSLEGASLALPGFFKLGGVAADWLRAGVTRTPLYIARKLLREPMAASFTGGLESNTFSSIFKAGAEFLRMSTGSSDAQAKLIEKGLIQSNIFAGDMSDMKKMALQLASGKDQSVWEKVFAAADRYAMRADAATLALVLKNAEANGLSEVEADMATMESMNFYKRGLSPTLQYASRLIPFFNAQIQGLNVLVKAARGNMPFEEQQEIKRKFYNNALLLMGTGLVYAMAMEDDETFRNARPRDKYSNFFMPIPGVKEPLKLPMPFEAGYFFSLAVAAVDSMRAETDGKAQWQAIRDLFLSSVPGYSSMFIPQLAKPAFEVWSNKNFLTGGAVESARFQGLDPEARYLATTTELAKQMSKAVPILSPIQIEHIVRGYFGVLPLAAVAAANGLFEREGKGAAPASRASDMPLIGTAFQKKYGGADADVVFREAKEIEQSRNTFNDILKSGRREEALEYRDSHRVELAMASAAGQYRQVIGRINADVRRTQERNDLTPEEKRLRLDALDKARQDRAEAFLKMQRATESRVEAGKT